MTTKALFVFGTRPEAIKLFPIIHAATRRPGWEPIVGVTGQHRRMLDQVLELAGIRPDYDLDIMRPEQDLASVASAALSGVVSVIDQSAADLVFVQGDTTTAMAGALAAFYRRRPVIHVEAGLRSGDMAAPFPEEANRRIVAVLATRHMAPTPRARDNLVREGVDQRSIFVTGNTVVDALVWMRQRLSQDDARAGMAGLGVPALDVSKRLVLVTAHRRENLDGGIARIAEALLAIASRGDAEIVFPVHLNPRVRAAVWPILAAHPGVHLVEPLDYLQFVALLSRAYLVITDSGGIQEEAPAFGVPVLVTRENTERPEAIAAGTAKLVGADTARIVREANRLLDDHAAHAAMSRVHNPFGDGHSAERMLDILEREFGPPSHSRANSRAGESDPVG